MHIPNFWTVPNHRRFYERVKLGLMHPFIEAASAIWVLLLDALSTGRRRSKECWESFSYQSHSLKIWLVRMAWWRSSLHLINWNNSKDVHHTILTNQIFNEWLWYVKLSQLSFERLLPTATPVGNSVLFNERMDCSKSDVYTNPKNPKPNPNPWNLHSFTSENAEFSLIN